MRENYEYYFTVPRTFVQDYRNLRYARISMLWSNDSSQNRVSTDQYHDRMEGSDLNSWSWLNFLWSSLIISYQFSTDRRLRLEKPAVTSKGPLKWETFQKKGNNETEKSEPDFYKSRTVNWLNRRVMSWMNWKWTINQLLNPSTFAKSWTISLPRSALL